MFTRIFYLLDRDVDGQLNDEELVEFQKQCFGREFETGDLEGIKSIVRNSFAKGVRRSY